MSDRNSLQLDSLIERAAQTARVSSRGDSWRAGLDVFIEDVNRSNSLNPTGQAFAEAWIVEHLAARFAMEDWIARHPQVLDKPVMAPVFILGLPRAGTTLLLNMLSLDPRHRPYWNWEANREIPPVEARHLQDDPRIARKVAEVNAGLAAGVLDQRHHVEMGDEPTECVWLLAQDFKAYPWLVLTAAPRYLHWLLNDADMVAAYRSHKRALQVLQSRAPGRWILKYPSHALFIDELLEVYPDARIVVTHRDPIKPLGSSCSASHHIMAQFNDNLDPAVVGDQTLAIIVSSLKNICALRERHPQTPVHDLYYQDMVADPMGQIQRLYDFMDEVLLPEVDQSMRAALVEHEQRRTVAGKHIYNVSDYGLDAYQLPGIFADYMKQFGVQPE